MINQQTEYLPFLNNSENIQISTDSTLENNKYFNLEKLKFVTICVTSGTALGAVAGWIVGDVILGIQFSFVCSSFFSMFY
jgi:hypothetical protein